MSALAVGHPDPTDSELVGAYLQGNERAATALVNRHAAPLARYLLGLGAPEADLDDLVQVAFVKAFKSLSGFRGDSSFRGWLYKIGANTARDLHRRTVRWKVIPLEDRDFPDSSDPEGETLASEVGQRLGSALNKLPGKQREVFLLRAQQGMDYEEIAAAIGSTPGAARVHYHHAVRRLKEALI